jgi:cytochrome c553
MRIGTIGGVFFAAAFSSALALAQVNQNLPKDEPKPADAPPSITNPAQAPAEVIRPAEAPNAAKPAETPADLAKPLAPPKDAAKPADKSIEAAKPDAPKTYIPGLEQFMGVIQNEHMKLGFAGKANNWELAAYQLAEIKELLGDIQDLVPKFKDVSLTDMIDAVIVGPITDLEKAIDAKDARKFVAGYDHLITACNSCHEATGNGFIVIQRPATNPFANQRFEPRKK